MRNHQIWDARGSNDLDLDLLCDTKLEAAGVGGMSRQGDLEVSCKKHLFLCAMAFAFGTNGIASEYLHSTYSPPAGGRYLMKENKTVEERIKLCSDEGR